MASDRRRYFFKSHYKIWTFKVVLTTHWWIQTTIFTGFDPLVKMKVNSGDHIAEKNSKMSLALASLIEFSSVYNGVLELLWDKSHTVSDLQFFYQFDDERIWAGRENVNRLNLFGVPSPLFKLFFSK